jgi:hypothetical protein
MDETSLEGLQKNAAVLPVRGVSIPGVGHFSLAEFTNVKNERKVLCIKYLRIKTGIIGGETSEWLTVFKSGVIRAVE